MRKVTIRETSTLEGVITYQKTTWYLLGFIPVFSSTIKEK